MPHSMSALLDAFYPWSRLGVAGLGAALLVLLLTPLLIRWARPQGRVEALSASREEKTPTALLGGLALFVGVGGSAALSGGLAAFPWPVWAGAALVFVTGLVDDLWDLRPETKLVVQIASVALVLSAGIAFWRGGPVWVSIPLTFLWVIGVTNAVNLVDGLDGLAAGLTAVAASVLAFISVALGQEPLALVAIALASGSLAFLAYNARPARIFMGDCGSLFLGFVLAVAALDVQGTGGPLTGTLVPIVVLAVPIFDTTFVTVSRILDGRPVTKGDTDHTHHRLVRLGLSESETVLVLWGVGTLFGGLALLVLWTTAELFVALVLLCLVGAAVFGLYLMESPSYESSSRQARSVTQRIGALMRALAGGSYWKSVAGVVADLLVVVAAYVLAVHLRFGGSPSAVQVELMIHALPVIAAVKTTLFYAFGLYHGIWRHAGTPEALHLFKASTVASLLVGGGLLVVFGADVVSLSVLVLDWMITTGAIGSARFGFRALRQYFAARQGGARRALLYGSGSHEMLLLRHLRHRPGRPWTVVGILDERPGRQGLRVQGVDVLGGPDDLARICKEREVDELIVPVETTTKTERRHLGDVCGWLDVVCQQFAFDRQRIAPREKKRSVMNGDGALIATRGREDFFS